MFHREIMKYPFLNERRPSLNATQWYIQLEFKLELEHNLWEFIAIFQYRNLTFM